MSKNAKQDQYRRICSDLNPKGWICMGSAIERTYTRVQADGQAKKCGPYYSWTRKIDNKTVTTALTKQQFRLVQKAILRNQQLDKKLVALRNISIKQMLSTTTCVARRKRNRSS